MSAPSSIWTTLARWPGHSWLCLLARLYMGYVFVGASVHKIANPGSFALDVATYQLLPLPLINITALVMPCTEYLAGAMIIVGFRTRAAALLLSAMMVVFMISLGWALHLGLDMSCGCFASASEGDSISGLTMLRDAAWLALCLYVLFLDRRPLGLDRLMAPK